MRRAFKANVGLVALVSFYHVGRGASSGLPFTFSSQALVDLHDDHGGESRAFPAGFSVQVGRGAAALAQSRQPLLDFLSFRYSLCRHGRRRLGLLVEVKIGCVRNLCECSVYRCGFVRVRASLRGMDTRERTCAF